MIEYEDFFFKTKKIKKDYNFLQHIFISEADFILFCKKIFDNVQFIQELYLFYISMLKNKLFLQLLIINIENIETHKNILLVNFKNTDDSKKCAYIILVFLLKKFYDISKFLIAKYQFEDIYFINTLRFVKYKISILNNKFDMIFFEHMLNQLVDHINYRSITLNNFEVTKKICNNVISDDSYLNTLSKTIEVGELHLLDDAKMTIDIAKLNIQQLHSRYVAFFKSIPMLYTMRSWIFDPTIKKIFHNTYLNDVMNSAFIVDSLKEESDEIFYYVQNKNTKLSNFIYKNTKTKFYKGFGYFKVINNNLVFKDD